MPTVNPTVLAWYERHLETSRVAIRLLVSGKRTPLDAVSVPAVDGTGFEAARMSFLGHAALVRLGRPDHRYVVTRPGDLEARTRLVSEVTQSCSRRRAGTSHG